MTVPPTYVNPAQSAGCIGCIGCDAGGINPSFEFAKISSSFPVAACGFATFGEMRQINDL
jgi:hypothetical protein